MAAPLSDTLTVHARIAEIGREAWDACAAPSGDPFLSFDFLDAMEASGCAVEAEGWGPRHLVLRDAEDRPAGVAPLYLKGHSQGEYVFDHAWADAYQRAGGAYYPKLQVCVPFTPVTGPRFLVRPDVDPEAGRERLISGALALADEAGVSSLHVTFPTEAEWRALGERGFLQRTDIPYVWENRGYATYEDFLGDLSSGRRKTLRRERREAVEGLTVRTLTGAELTEAVWDAVYAFYADTGARKWGRPYLNRRFFSLIGERMAERTVLFLAEDAGRPVGGALNFLGTQALYGRWWGALEHRPFLHFELCYHRAVDFAIERGLTRVEAGAQGEHKMARGYRPRLVYSAHQIADPRLRAPVAAYLARERPAVAAERDALEAEYSPFRARS